MPDDFGVYDGMKVWEFLDFFAVAYEIPRSYRKKIIGEEEELIAKMVEAGVSVTRPDRESFRALMEPAYQSIKLYAGEDNVRIFKKMVDGERKP